MSGELQRVAMVSMHTSPDALPGRGDSGGLNISLLALAQGFADRGVEVDLLTRAVAEPRAVELSAGVTLRSLAAGPTEPMPKGRLPEFADEFGEAVATLAGRAAPRYDVIHAHYWLSGLATLPVALELGLPFVQSFHTIGAMKNTTLAPGEAPEPLARLRGETYLASQSDAVIAGSSAEVASIIDDLRAPAERLWVIPPGVDTELFDPARSMRADEVRAALGLPPGRPMLLVVGRIQPLKGQDLAIRVLAQLPAALTPPPLLVFAGEPTAGAEGYSSSLARLADELGVAVDIRFLGALEREELADLFAAASLTMIPSRSETFGLVALESAASGTPVVGYRGTGLVESVADGESGLLVDSREPADWARTVAGLLEDPALLERLGASARGHAEGFTWATTGASLLAVYESLLVPLGQGLP